MGCPTTKRNKSRHSHKRDRKTKYRKRDIDEVDDDIKEENYEKNLHQDIDLDKPGAAQHYCLHCARYFINQATLVGHFRSKPHKRRLKQLILEPYSQAEAEAAAGHGDMFETKRRKIETQPVDEEVVDEGTVQPVTE